MFNVFLSFLVGVTVALSSAKLTTGLAVSWWVILGPIGFVVGLLLIGVLLAGWTLAQIIEEIEEADQTPTTDQE